MKSVWRIENSRSEHRRHSASLRPPLPHRIGLLKYDGRTGTHIYSRASSIPLRIRRYFIGVVNTCGVGRAPVSASANKALR